MPWTVRLGYYGLDRNLVTQNVIRFDARIL